MLIYGQAGAGGFAGCQDGGSCNPNQSGSHDGGGDGGNASGNASIAINSAKQPVAIATAGSRSPAMVVFLQGGAGGAGGSDTNFDQANSGDGGNGGSVTGGISVNLTGASQAVPVMLTTNGTSSPGVYAVSLGGNGAASGDGTATIGSSFAHNGGNGGAGGNVTIGLSQAAISTTADSSPGIVAVSQGGIGGNGGFGGAGIGESGGGDGGNGGGTGTVMVMLGTGASILTQGTTSMGILAQTLAAAGGDGDGNTGDAGGAGGGGQGGTAQNVTVTNNGTITTQNTGSRGIFAQSMVLGGGGSGGSSYGLFSSDGGSGGGPGASGSVTVTNAGSISTTGQGAEGILAQSIGGTGGAGGQANGITFTVGGTGGTDPFTTTGGSVTINNLGNISTTGQLGIGILGQSIGGGGGDGGNASGLSVAIGGSGANGGIGGPVAAYLTGGLIQTANDLSPGVVMQSIGGGGGNGGNSAANGLITAVTLGGTAGTGANGGQSQIVDTGTSISTSGGKSPGLVAQSIGGGGGNGGGATSYSVGAGASASVAVGGGGTSGGNGGWASVTLSGASVATGQNPELVNGTAMPPGQSVCPSSLPCNILPVDDYGAVVQSVGGGGGLGGNSVAKALAVAVPTPPSGNQVAVAASASVGGTGGDGGAGGLAEFSLSNGGSISTRGQGSTAVLAQSIGGGGGAGGDSSTLAAALGYNKILPGDTSSTGITGTFNMGGQAGSGGVGGAVNVALGGTVTNGSFVQDASGDAPTAIATYGDYADGIKAQSIGGGGGDAGVGSSNTQQFGTGTSYKMSLSLGASGGSGGAGSTVQVSLYPDSAITTWGSNALGMVAQSIGGGGGASQGGSLAVSDGSNFGVKLGTSGPSGGNGGNVTIAIQSPIVTHGGDATAVLAQSVGGGGGLGGSAGSDASADNPVTGPENARQQASAFANYLAGKGSINANFNLSLGGSGGSGGNGGNVTVGTSSNVGTTGDWANGIIAQSVGGGGGKAGTAAATGSGSDKNLTVNINEAIGGNGGAGGSGGEVVLGLYPGPGSLSPTISTQGYGATALIAQSVGGGGGVGADGSDVAVGTISLGVQAGGNGGTGGPGGPVTVNYEAPVGTMVTTAGPGADGITAQSIGGGGGMGGAGSSAFPGALANTLAISVGGASGASGDGGAVTVQSQQGGVISIATQGYNSYGILAQSVGGGGGSVITQQSATSISTEVGGTSQSANGGPVSVSLGAGSSVTTSGVGAHGIVAQSVGGGGGIIRVLGSASDTPSVTTFLYNPSQPQFGSGNGGAVTVNSSGAVTVNGAGAVGILAQSLGGGGGIISTSSGIFVGNPNSNNYTCGYNPCSGSGGAVTVNVSGPISSLGQNGIGIVAESAGYGLPGVASGTTTVNVNSNVVGGHGGIGILATGWDNILQSANGNSFINVGPGGSITTLDGVAGTAVQSIAGTVQISNNGPVTGKLINAYLLNQASGTWNAGSDLVGSALNKGTVNLGLPGSGVPTSTHVTGDFVQTATGKLNLIVDSLNSRFGRLRVDGTAAINGAIVPTAVSLLPGALPVITAGALNTSALAPGSLLFNWSATSSGNTLNLSPSSNFTPGNVSLTASEFSLGIYLNKAWGNSDAAFATRFASLSQLNDPAQYATMLDAYSGKATEAQALALINSTGTILGASMSCPVFINQGVLLGEDSCVWAKVTGQQSNQWETGDTLGYHVASTSYRLGGQREIAPSWYLGGSFAVGQTWASTDGTASGSSSGNGQTYDGSIALKHTIGPWLFAGSIALADGQFRSNRFVNIPGEAASLQSNPTAFVVGGRLRAGYEFAFGDWYVRPYGDLDVIYSNLPGFQESGPSLVALNVHGGSKTTVGISPMVELGGRLDLDAKTTLRPFVAVGLSLFPDNDRSVDANFIGASAADGTFRSMLKSPDVLGNIEFGAQLYRAGGLELKAEYDANIGGSFLSQGASARLAYHF